MHTASVMHPAGGEQVEEKHEQQEEEACHEEKEKRGATGKKTQLNKKTRKKKKKGVVSELVELVTVKKKPATAGKNANNPSSSSSGSGSKGRSGNGGQSGGVVRSARRLINQMNHGQLVNAAAELKVERKGSAKALRDRLKQAVNKRITKPQPQQVQDSSRLSKKHGKDATFICVVDFEATCEEDDANFPHEIIEFPLVIIDVHRKEIVEKQQFYCRPVFNPILSPFCTQLTGIKQESVDSAAEFPHVLDQVMAILDKYRSHDAGHKLLLASDGPWDFRNFFQWQCRASSVPAPALMHQWLDIRKAFRACRGGVKRRGDQLLNMLSFYDLEFEGEPHCGLDDAFNAARVLLQMLEKDGLRPRHNTVLSQCAPNPRYMRRIPHLQRNVDHQHHDHQHHDHQQQQAQSERKRAKARTRHNRSEEAEGGGDAKCRAPT